VLNFTYYLKYNLLNRKLKIFSQIFAAFVARKMTHFQGIDFLLKLILQNVNCINY